ncbi:hypothetical protein VTK26DRAFT_5405 [Humicola hyalothermophila]
MESYKSGHPRPLPLCVAIAVTPKSTFTRRAIKQRSTSRDTAAVAVTGLSHESGWLAQSRAGTTRCWSTRTTAAFMSNGAGACPAVAVPTQPLPRSCTTTTRLMRSPRASTRAAGWARPGTASPRTGPSSTCPRERSACGWTVPVAPAPM